MARVLAYNETLQIVKTFKEIPLLRSYPKHQMTLQSHQRSKQTHHEFLCRYNYIHSVSWIYPYDHSIDCLYSVVRYILAMTVIIDSQVLLQREFCCYYALLSEIEVISRASTK